MKHSIFALLLSVSGVLSAVDDNEVNEVNLDWGDHEESQETLKKLSQTKSEVQSGWEYGEEYGEEDKVSEENKPDTQDMSRFQQAMKIKNEGEDDSAEPGRNKVLQKTTSGSDVLPPLIAQLPQCARGYNRTKAASWGCTDINECSHLPWNNCTTVNPCVNTPGSFYCRCPVGYNGSSPNCKDINECTMNHTCTLNAKYGQICNNTLGSFKCTCKPGYAASGTVTNYTHLNCTQTNECLARTNNCHARGNCTDTAGSFTCKCNAGYIGDGVICADMDECVLGFHACHKHADCTDTVGSFTCECKVGFAGNGTNCTEINECNATLAPNVTKLNASRGVQAGVHNCANNISTCTNTVGSYLCACNTGYSGTGKTCIDINECTEKLHNCTTHSICNNTVGSYTCSCKIGFKMANGTDGINGTCIDINECSINALARGGGTTTTTTGDGVAAPYVYGRFSTPTPSKVSLLQTGDVDEGSHTSDAELDLSTIPNALCHEKADCMNGLGSFNCVCRRGYYGDGQSCQNMNECTSGLHNCDAHALCIDTEGSFKCKCHSGYNGSGTRYSGGWPPVDGCWDYDECTNETQAQLRWNLTNMSKLKEPPYNSTRLDVCHAGGAVCRNSVGSFSCHCKEGWEGDGLTCKDIDECALRRHNCDNDAWCNNTNGSFTCHCGRGWTPDVEGSTKGNPPETRLGIKCESWKKIEIGQARLKMVNNVSFNGKMWIKYFGWQQVNFSSPFEVPLHRGPVVVVQLPQAFPRETYPRIRRITNKGFQVQIAFANSTNRTIDDEYFETLNRSIFSISYIAVAEGVHSLPDGTVIVAWHQSLNASMTRSNGCINRKGSWNKINFPTFTERPVLLSQLTGVDDRKWKGGGMRANSFCVSAIRFNATWNESNNSNNSAWVARVCPDATFASDKPYNGVERIGWIAIGSNYSNVSKPSLFFYDNWTAASNKTVKYVSLVNKVNLTGLGVAENVTHGHNFTTAPLVIGGKVATNMYDAGNLELTGALGTKLYFKTKDDKSCDSKRKHDAYFNAFVSEKMFSI